VAKSASAAVKRNEALRMRLMVIDHWSLVHGFEIRGFCASNLD
jgi:hypothetical protein